MRLLKYKIGKEKYLYRLGVYDGCLIYQVIRKATIKEGWWRCYFVIEKDNKRHRVFSKKKANQLTTHFLSKICKIVTKFSGTLESSNYVGRIENYYGWEGWRKGSSDYIYIFYNQKNYIIVTDKEQIQHLQAYFLVQKTYYRQ